MSYISAKQIGNRVLIWERLGKGEPRTTVDYPAEHYFYVDDFKGNYTTMFGTNVRRESFRSRKDKVAAQERYTSMKIRTWESDISPVLRVLSKQYYNVPPPHLNITFYDIETDNGINAGYARPIDPWAPVNAVSIYHQYLNQLELYIVPSSKYVDWTEQRLYDECNSIEPFPDDFRVIIRRCSTEAELLWYYVDSIQDSDVVVGWNSANYDDPYMAGRIKRVLGEGAFKRLDFEEADPPVLERVETNVTTNTAALKDEDPDTIDSDPDDPNAVTDTMVVAFKTKGRAFWDYMLLMKKYDADQRPSYKLASVADTVLIDENHNPILPKLEYEGSLANLYETDLPRFCRYSIRDSEILRGFELKLGYVGIANANYHISTGLPEHVLGTLKLSELSLINAYHHERKQVVNDNVPPLIDRSIEGALVLLPKIGLHKFIGSIDIKSLYPSVIRLLGLSPETIIGQFQEEFDACVAISRRTDELLTLVIDGDDMKNPETRTHTAREWADILRDNNWAISGYGTVLNQNIDGMLPAVLTEWFEKRIQYQTMKLEWMAKAKGLVSKYKDSPRETGIKRGKVLMSNEDATLYDEWVGKSEYYDRLQYVFKIKLNSVYGALSNLHFRFYDLRLAESTTATGRMILKHQCRKVNELFEGKYDIDFPMYDNLKSAKERGLGIDVCLDGPIFNGKYQTDSVIYGDTDSCYFDTGATNTPDAVLIADEIAKLVNASFPDYVQKDFFVCDKNKHMIKTSREIVSDNGIFVDKKRYILHLVDVDGYPVDKMKIMGLDTKKTTLPVAVSIELNKFIERLLKGETWLEICPSIVAYKQSLLDNMELREIGLPRGINKVEFYTNEFNTKAKARIPGHVSAAIFYNKCLETFGDQTSIQIRSGMKLKVFYLTSSIGKFKSIALPTDIEHIPDWFVDNFSVANDAHISRLVDKPLYNIIKAIGERVPTVSSLAVESAWEL
jgi:DNA polymerase elongation subunit (family B)